jgi:hypothetical protein
MNRSLALAFLLLLSSCADEPATVATEGLASGVTVERVLSPTDAVWWVSPLSGDRGSAWRSPDYRPSDADGWIQVAAPLGYGYSYDNFRVIPYGPDPERKPTTVYLTRTVVIDDPEDVVGLRLYTRVNDGFVFYINGQEAGRSGLRGTVTYSTLASDRGRAIVDATVDVTPQRALLRHGVNTLAFEVHQSGPSSPELYFAAQLTASMALPPPPPPASGFELGSRWRLWDRGGDLGVAWREPGFDDSTWFVRPAPLGYGESYIRTPLGYGGDPGQKYITSYFRHSFTAPELAGQKLASIFLRLLYDDGIVVYLNGHEIHRAAMPAGPVGADTLSLGHEAVLPYEIFDVTDAAAPYLVAGENVLAAEVHQVNGSSSDLVFDLGLNFYPMPIFRRDPANPVLAGGTWDVSRNDPDVLHLPDGSWLMFYAGTDDLGPFDPAYRIGRATSPDGVTWTADPEPLFEGRMPSVLHEETGFRMWYAANDDWDGIRLATSADGVTWTTSAEPVLSSSGYPGWDYAITHPSVIKEGDVYKMWYVGKAIDDWRRMIGYATSPDGVHWTRATAPLIEEDSLSVYVLHDQGEYKMWRSDMNHELAYASSADGIHWIHLDDSLPWDYGHPDALVRTRSASVQRDGGRLRLWYDGVNYLEPEDVYQIGHASSP